MPYNLATNRYGLFVNVSFPDEEREDVVKDLRDRITSSMRQKAFAQIGQTLLEVAKEEDPHASLEKSSKNQGGVHEVFSSLDEHTQCQILVGLFPCSKLQIRIRDVTWLITVRASVAI